MGLTVTVKILPQVKGYFSNTPEFETIVNYLHQSG